MVIVYYLEIAKIQNCPLSCCQYWPVSRNLLVTGENICIASDQKKNEFLINNLFSLSSAAGDGAIVTFSDIFPKPEIAGCHDFANIWCALMSGDCYGD